MWHLDKLKCFYADHIFSGFHKFHGNSSFYIHCKTKITWVPWICVHTYPLVKTSVQKKSPRHLMGDLVWCSHFLRERIHTYLENGGFYAPQRHTEYECHSWCIHDHIEPNHNQQHQHQRQTTPAGPVWVWRGGVDCWMAHYVHMNHQQEQQRHQSEQDSQRHFLTRVLVFAVKQTK